MEMYIFFKRDFHEKSVDVCVSSMTFSHLTETRDFIPINFDHQVNIQSCFPPITRDWIQVKSFTKGVCIIVDHHVVALHPLTNFFTKINTRSVDQVLNKLLPINTFICCFKDSWYVVEERVSKNHSDCEKKFDRRDCHLIYLSETVFKEPFWFLNYVTSLIEWWAHKLKTIRFA